MTIIQRDNNKIRDHTRTIIKCKRSCASSSTLIKHPIKSNVRPGVTFMMTISQCRLVSTTRNRRDLIAVNSPALGILRGLYSDFIYSRCCRELVFLRSVKKKKRNKATRAIIFTKSHCTKKKKKTVIFLLFPPRYTRATECSCIKTKSSFSYTSDFHFLPLTIHPFVIILSSFVFHYGPADRL